MEILVLLMAVGLGIYLWHSRSRREQQVTHAVVHNVGQRLVESKMIDILASDPNLPDDTVAQMVRDDLITAQVRDPQVFYWATPETSARLKRLAVRMVAENERRMPVLKGRAKELAEDD